MEYIKKKMNNIKLTSYSSGAGWACKINPKDLGKILEKLSKTELIINKDIKEVIEEKVSQDDLHLFNAELYSNALMSN